jgi:hypothetical protein
MRHIPKLLVLLFVAFVAGCVSTPRVTSDMDPSADFSKYRTYAFYSPLAVESKGYATPATQLMRDAVRREMDARGYVYDERDPDLLVNMNAYLERRTDVYSTPEMHYGMYYSYRHNTYIAVPYWGERTDVRRYTEGTMNVDLVDAERNRLVWEGIAVGRMARMQPEQRAERIHMTIAEIFARYPHRAGGR